MDGYRTLRHCTVVAMRDDKKAGRGESRRARKTNELAQMAYQISEGALRLVRSFGSERWQKALATYLESTENLLEIRHRQMELIPVRLPNGDEVKISAGGQNELIKGIVEKFSPRFAPGASVLYIGRRGGQVFGIVNEAASFDKMGIVLDPHGKMPDVVVHHTVKDWLN